METVIFDNDIKVLYIEATSFPDGIMDAHRKLHSLIPFSAHRRYFGISRPENGTIRYKAAADEISPGEAESLQCDSLILKKGNYASLPINDYMKNMPSIGQAFTQLLALPNLDPEGYCVEWYLSDKDVKCMIRLVD